MDPATIVTSGVSYIKILEMVLNLGPIGLVLVFWYFGQQKTDEIQRRADERVQAMMDRYAADMQEMRDMYKTNSALVKRYADLADDLKDIITLNTQTMTRLVEKIEKEVIKWTAKY